MMDANNHDRWIVSYADFITLLFAFFVVMYSISSVNEGKYKSLSHSLGNAFSNELKPEVVVNTVVHDIASLHTSETIPLTIAFEAKSLAKEIVGPDESEWKLNPKSSTTDKVSLSFKLDPTSFADYLTVSFESTGQSTPITTKTESPTELGINPEKKDPVQIKPVSEIGQIELLNKLAVEFESAPLTTKLPEPEIEKRRELSDEILKERKHLNQVSDQLEQGLGGFIKDDLVAVKRNDYWIELEMNSELLFLSGEATLSKKAQPVLKEIAEIINSLPNAINVEGHTDNVPISNLKFPSNWELSSARATSVVQELVNAGVDPTHLSAVGYGEFHPIGDNSNEEGRFKNRRVTMVLMSQAFARYGTNDAERAKLLNLKPATEANVNQP
jgi:chemotaxis protein MotB